MAKSVLACSPDCNALVFKLLKVCLVLVAMAAFFSIFILLSVTATMVVSIVELISLTNSPISLLDCLTRSARARTSSATIANPLPCSLALAA